ncbi:MAG: ornithine cyclodeaminase family protein [Blastocatellia bacterium]
MKILILNHNEVARLLPMRECIEVMAEALIALARGAALNPLRGMLPVPDGKLGIMPAYLGDTAMGLKAVSIFHGNAGTPFDSHQGMVLLLEAKHGLPLAIAEAGAITAIRTAAVSAVATRALARADAHTLAILGAGVQARTHVEAMLCVREISEIRIWSRNAQHAQTLAQGVREQYGVKVDTMTTVREAAHGADIICTTTAAHDPILRGEWIAPGAHINAVGASTPDARELDTAAIRNSLLYVDCREAALHEAGDFLIPLGEGAITEDHILGEIGEVLLGQTPGRTADDEVTVFKSLGLGIEDVAAIQHMYRAALEQGAGTWVEFAPGPQITI